MNLKPKIIKAIDAESDEASRLGSPVVEADRVGCNSGEGGCIPTMIYYGNDISFVI